MDAKKGALAIVVLFLGFWMFKDPTGLADVASAGAGSGWAMLTKFFDATINFLNELF